MEHVVLRHHGAMSKSTDHPIDRMRQADWYHDDLRHVGLDFSDPVQVATCDARQRSGDAAAAQLLAELGVQPGQTLADIGCGTGVLACQAALLGCHVMAVDTRRERDPCARRAQHLRVDHGRPDRAGRPGDPVARPCARRVRHLRGRQTVSGAA